MGSNYLQGVTDGYNLPSQLPVGVAQLASTIVDSYLRRNEGLLYISDASGNPCAMQAMTPSFCYTLAGDIAPGTNVSVQVTPANVRPTLVGEVLTLDFDNPATVESCVVVSVSGANTITLDRVQFAHATGTNADVGRVLTEDRVCPSKRSIVRVDKYPIVGILSLMGRYGYGRRSDQVGGLYQEMNLLASVQTFGGPPQWIPIPVANADWSDSTGEIWVPAGMLLAYYSDVRVKYVAGYKYPPDPVVRATAQIANSILSNPDLAGGLKVIAAGDTRLERFTNSTVDDDVKGLLDSFRARTFY